MILAIGNSGEYEMASFNAVARVLRKHGHDVLLFKQDKCLEKDYLTFEIINGRFIYEIIIDGKTYDIDDFSAIWYMKPHLPQKLLEFEPIEYRQLLHRQFQQMRRAIWTIFSHKKWLNNPWAVQIAEDKLHQLQLAIKVGFTVPNTVVTSDPSKVKFFYEQHSENIIVKLLATSPILDKVIYANKVTREDIKHIISVKQSPSIFQACILKKHELRITVVGNKIFPVKINSQEDKETALDWRRKPKLNDYEVKMEQTVIPLEIEKRIYDFMRAANLRFGCIDMIVTPANEYVFLEINPNGQWYFVQLRTEAQIAEAIADLLI